MADSILHIACPSFRHFSKVAVHSRWSFLTASRSRSVMVGCAEPLDYTPRGATGTDVREVKLIGTHTPQPLHFVYVPATFSRPYEARAPCIALCALSKHCRISSISGRLIGSMASSNVLAAFTNMTHSSNFHAPNSKRRAAKTSGFLSGPVRFAAAC